MLFQGYRILSSGREDGLHRSGVAPILGKRAQEALMNFEPQIDRILTAIFKIMTGCLINVKSTHAPTAAAEEEEIENSMKSCNTSSTKPQRVFCRLCHDVSNEC